jgi:hypothetical protein
LPEQVAGPNGDGPNSLKGGYLPSGPASKTSLHTTTIGEIAFRVPKLRITGNTLFYVASHALSFQIALDCSIRLIRLTAAESTNVLQSTGAFPHLDRYWPRRGLSERELIADFDRISGNDHEELTI